MTARKLAQQEALHQHAQGVVQLKLGAHNKAVKRSEQALKLLS